jgi:hypothetical protein
VALLETLMHSIGRGGLDIWLTILMRDVTTQEKGSREVSENLWLDIANEDFTINMETHFNAVEVTPGVLCMFILHPLITTAYIQMGVPHGQLWASIE